MSKIPEITIITINYNNVEGLQKTVDSVFSQDFKDLNYIIIDGGSEDGSRDVIKSIETKLSYWVSEEDKGVYHAMNKGIEKATGEYILFLNSGDHFRDKNVLNEVYPSLDGTGIIYGNILLIENETKSWIAYYPNVLSFQFFIKSTLPHCGSFIKRDLFGRVGCYDESLLICGDWKFFIDAVCRYNVSYKLINKEISTFYLDGLSSKLESSRIIEKEKAVVLENNYRMFLSMYNELSELKNTRTSKWKELLNKVKYRIHKT